MPARLRDLEHFFLQHLRAEGLSPNTLRLYRQAIRLLSNWLEPEGRATTLDELNRPAIREWLASLSQRGQELGTVKTCYRCLHRFCTWLVDSRS